MPEPRNAEQAAAGGFPSGASICQCASCDQVFANLTGFDAHRDGPIESRVCVYPGLIGYEQDERGVWATPERIAANADLKSRTEARRAAAASSGVSGD